LFPDTNFTTEADIPGRSGRMATLVYTAFFYLSVWPQSLACMF